MKVTVLQWNVWYKEDFNKIVDFLKLHSADIICLQEIPIGYTASTVHEPQELLAKKLEYNYFHKEVPIDDTDGTQRILGNGIFTKYPIHKKSFAWIKESSGAGGYNDESRAYVEVLLRLEGQDIVVGTTHMSYTHKFEPNESKELETDELCKELSRHDRKYIFAGDLNALPESYTVRSVSKILQNVGPEVNQKTWTTKPFSYNGFEAITLDWRLDYIFASKDIKVLDAKILQTNFSDHLPIFATLEI